ALRACRFYARPPKEAPVNAGGPKFAQPPAENGRSWVAFSWSSPGRNRVAHSSVYAARTVYILIEVQTPLIAARFLVQQNDNAPYERGVVKVRYGGTLTRLRSRQAHP